MADVLGRYPASAVGVVDLVAATEPVGEGWANTQVESVGLVDFVGTDCSVSYTVENGVGR